MGVVIGSPGKSPSHANTLINLTLVDPRFLTGALICAHLQPHGLYHAVGAWSPLLSASEHPRELRFRRRLHLPAIIVLQCLHHMCGRAGAAAEHESTATPSRRRPCFSTLTNPTSSDYLTRRSGGMVPPSPHNLRPERSICISDR